MERCVGIVLLMIVLFALHIHARSSAAAARSPNFYSVLGVEKGASDSEIKKAYRKLAMKVTQQWQISDASSNYHYISPCDAAG
jgi:preprotein translocase subunit Sec63